ncbi:hypothetical protein LDENG_00256970 [Lucifuga dentata]|nr:hypothetical protein LDENG_00256970 [Lucifuga dentata]
MPTCPRPKDTWMLNWTRTWPRPTQTAWSDADGLTRTRLARSRRRAEQQLRQQDVHDRMQQETKVSAGAAFPFLELLLNF